MARRLARSFLRILTATVLIAAAGLAVLAAALRQPTLTNLPFRGSSRASARHLEEHVRFLTTEVMPRRTRNPANLDRAAEYIAERFRAAGGRTFQQSFHAYGTRYTNVLAEFGPEGSRDPVLIVGAHYDAFGDRCAPRRRRQRQRHRRPARTGPPPRAHPPATPVAPGRLHDGRAALLRLRPDGQRHPRQQRRRGRTASADMICLEMIGYFSPEQTWPNATLRLDLPLHRQLHRRRRRLDRPQTRAQVKRAMPAPATSRRQLQRPPTTAPTPPITATTGATAGPPS